MRASSSVLAFAPLFAALVTGCDVTAPQSGAIRVVVATSGVDVDPDGYSVIVDRQPEQDLGINSTIIISGLAVGSRSVVLHGRAVNCLLGGSNPRSVSVVANDTVTVEFTLSCALLLGRVQLSVNTFGFDLDPDGYIVKMDDEGVQAIETSDILTFEDVREGLHSITLGGVAANCTVGFANPAPVLVAYAATTVLNIPVRCYWRPGTMRVTVATTGDSLDADGYTVVAYADYSLVRYIRVDANGVAALDDMPVGEYSISLANVAGNCRIVVSSPHATVATRQTTDVSFSLTCTRLGNIRVRSATTGVDPDPSGYQVATSRDGFDRIDTVASNGTVTVNGLYPADYSLTLEDAAVNCEAASSSARIATVTSGSTVDVVFDVACAPATQLAYWSPINGKPELHVVNSNGTALTPITPHAGESLEPSWSPDGSKIAFRSNLDGNHEIYVMSVSGLGPAQRLTTFVGLDYDPAWSPDGARIAFVSHREGSADIYVMNADGSNVVRLTTHPALDAEPAWSPDGSRIVFRSDRDGNPEIYVMNADGSGLVRLTTDYAFDGQPEWSPDGTTIAFTRAVGCDYYYYYNCHYNLHVMNADGSGVTRLYSVSDDSQPTWSPDGRWIAFATRRCSDYECEEGLWAAKPTGANRTEIVSGTVGNPAWRR